MHHSPFALFALGVLSSFISSSYGFSTSSLLSSATLEKSITRRRDQQALRRDPQRRCIDRGIVLLHAATDPTTVTSQTDEDDGSSYDFISVKEAEEALHQERNRYEGERSDLQWLLEVQRRQLQDLADGRRGKQNAGDGSGVRNAAGPSSRIVILGAHAHIDARKNRKKAAIGGSRNNANEDNRKKMNNNDGTYHRMDELENLLQDAIIENEKLTRQLREQHQEYILERSMYEEELQEESSRLNFVRDELHMERAYFETSRRMLEQLLEEEQQKVRQLEKELMMMISREEHVFSQKNQSEEGYQQMERTQHAQKQQQEEERQRQINNEKRRRVRAQAGFTMNINDVKSPLYP